MNFLTSSLARFLYAVPFVLFGLMHFPNAESMVSMVPSYVPGGILWVYITGVVLIAGGISIITGKHAVLGCKLLALLLLVFILTVHLPAVLAGGAAAHMGMVSLLKDMALMGAALSYADLFEKDLA